MSHINSLTKPFDTPPFSQIKLEDYIPAIENAVSISRENIDLIINNTDLPNFENTIEALEFATVELDKITTIFFNLNHADTSKEMQEMALKISTILTNLSNDISLNKTIFEKVKTVYENSKTEILDNEQKRLMTKTYDGFMRSGANLSLENKLTYRELTEQLAQLSLKFSQNLLAATNDYFLHITDESELDGLPEFVREIGLGEAESKGLEGWVFTLAAQSYVPFLQFSNNREYREKIWTRYNTRCYANDKNDNQENIIKIVNLRRQLAKLLGYKNYAEYVLEVKMSKTQQVVEDFLEDILVKTKPHALSDWETVANYAKESGFDGEIMPWDFGHYAEKYKVSKYNISDDKLKPYFKLENVYNGLFDILGKLYGVEFVENRLLDKYHKDVVVYDVIENTKKLAILYVDFFPRESKSSGAWMTSYKDKMIYNSVETTPIISIVCNFTKPTKNEPSLLTFNEVTTLFHEAGHAMHGIFAKGKYASINGTNVAWDYVELPSQIMENWASDSYFLNNWAKHYQTNEPIPQDYIEKLKESENFLSGYAQMRQLSFGVSDMCWHTITSDINVSVKEFETEALKKTKIMPFIENSCVSTAFSHIFAGGYAAGYYGYKWAEVLEADAFSLFEKNGAYNKQCSKSFRDNILSAGSHKDEMEQYMSFMGREPKTDALFQKLGLTEK